MLTKRDSILVFARSLASRLRLIALCPLLVLPVASAQQDNRRPLSVSFRSLAEASTFKNAAATQTGTNSASTQQNGREENWCTQDPSETSAAKASAAGKIIDSATAETVVIQLEVDALARGGKVRDCIEIPEFRGFKVYKKKTTFALTETLSVANASIGADVLLPLSTYPRGEKYELTIDTEGGDLPESVTLLVSANGLAIENISGKRRFVLDAGSTDYLAQISLSAKATMKGGEHENVTRMTVLPRLTLAKIDQRVASPKSDVADLPVLETLASGGDIEEEFDTVGAISLDGSVWCSGAVIGQRTVLTAAHCIKGEKNWENYSVTFTLGKSVNVATQESVYKVTHWRVPQFELPAIAFDTLNNSDDIALIYVDRNFNAVGSTQAQIALDPLEYAADDKPINQVSQANVRLIGFGYSAPNAPTTGKGERRRIELPLGRISSKTFEIANIAKRACKGDSGGPVVYPARNKKTQIIGIVSAGLRSGEQLSLDSKEKSLCYDQSVITRVDIYTQWISKFVDRPPQ